MVDPITVFTTAAAASQVAEQIIKYLTWPPLSSLEINLINQYVKPADREWPRTGKFLIDKYKAYHASETECMETLLRIEMISNRTKGQFQFLQRIWASIGVDMQICFYTSIQVVKTKLDKASVILDQLSKRREKDTRDENYVASKLKRSKKVEYALATKSSLQHLLQELVVWSDVFDPSWFLILRIPSTNIDQALHFYNNKDYVGAGRDQESHLVALNTKSDPMALMKSLRKTINSEDEAEPGFRYNPMSPDELLPGRTPIAHSEAEAASLRAPYNGRILVIVNKIVSSDHRGFADTRKDTRKLAKILSKVDPPTFGLLKCRGIIETEFEKERTVGKEKRYQFEFVFLAPPDARQMLTLRNLLAVKPKYDLNKRFDLARNLAKSVLFVHTAQFVHKNIRPDNIIMFAETNSSTYIEESEFTDRPFLIGFERFRLAVSATFLQSEGLWQHDLYRHPSRQGRQPECASKMQHDIYSLGVCLLEIGLWTPFVVWPSDAEPPVPGRGIDIAELKDVQFKEPAYRVDVQRVSAIKRKLIEMAMDELPHHTGQRYADIVVACLTCLETPLFGETSEFEDEYGIEIGERYIGKVLQELESLCV